MGLLARRLRLVVLACAWLLLASLHSVSASVECRSYSGHYDLYPDRVEAVETLVITFHGPGMILSSESLSPMPNLTEMRFQSAGRQINWSYDGDMVRWTYSPALADGDSVSYTRRWTEMVSASASGLRSIVIPIRRTSNASLLFTTHGVDITYSTLPLSDRGSYSGPARLDGWVVRFGTRYKLFTYSWRGTLENVGQRPAEVALNISIPWNGEFQHVLSYPDGDIVKDRLGNSWFHLEETLPKGGLREIEVNASAVTQTWPIGFQENISLANSSLVQPDQSYWQSGNQLIKEFALDLVNGSKGRLAQIESLAKGINRYLNYSIEPGRMGALWALQNRRGACMEYTDLFVAAARSLGIPALYVSGVCGSSNLRGFGHAWAIAELSNGTWIGADPTSGYVGHLDSGRLVLQLCNPVDVGASLRCTAGAARIATWSRSWEYRELGVDEAYRLLGVAESVPLFFTASVVSFAFLSVFSRRNRESI